MAKIDTLNSYIDKCDEYLKKEANEKKFLIEEIVGVYSEDIKTIDDELDCYHWSVLGNPTDFDGDLKKLKAKLIHYRDFLESPPVIKDPAPAICFTQNQNFTISINLESTIINVEKLVQTGALSEDEKDLLIGKLHGLDREKDKSTVWKKAKGVLTWITNKGMDVTIAALPYIIAKLQGQL